MALTQVQGGMILPSTTLTTPIVATTMGVGGATPSTSGAGITFPATQSASSNANTLDDYEEGTWTPIIGGTGGESSQSYSGQAGYYTKIGRMVYAQCRVALSAKGTITGNVLLKGLPFTADGAIGYGAGVSYWYGLATNWVYVFVSISGGTTQCEVRGAQSAVSESSSLTTTDIGNTSQFNASIIYFV
jgi:hypothetical protein